MARPLRLEFPGALYHVSAHGKARQKIFRNDADREAFLATLAWVIDRFGWVCHAYSLMDQEFQLLLETPQANLSRGMRQLNGVYTQNFNLRHGKAGHLFPGRFKSVVLERAPYLLALARYVVLTPVREKLVKKAQAYAWTSYRATMGLAPLPAALNSDWVLNQFAKTPAMARQRYAAFVQAGLGADDPWANLKGQVLLGSASFVKKMLPQLHAPAPSTKRSKRSRPTLKKLLAHTDTKAARDVAMARAYLQHGYTLAEIAQVAGLHYATVSRIIKAIEGRDAA